MCSFVPMKRIAAVLFVLFVLVSCSNEFQLTEDWKDIPIVYGLLNTADTAQYIRVEKAFIDENSSALDLAQIPDSLYYENAEVSIVRTSTGEVFNLTRVDGNDEGYVRETGVFAIAPNYLYKIRSEEIFPGNPDLYTGEEYTIQIKRNEDSPLVTATTNLIGKPEMASPAESSSAITFRPNATTVVSWRSFSGATIFDLTFSLNYVESINGSMFEQKNLIWKYARNIRESELVSVPIQGEEFFNHLAENIEEDENAIRVFQNVDIIVDSGSDDISEYLSIGQANLGITSSQDIPIYTNMSEGRGLFSSRHRFIRNPALPLSGITKDSLLDGSVTGHLNFQ